MRQLALSWQPETAYLPEDFIVTDANREACDFIGRWPDTTIAGNTALLVGPHSSGKTHLAHCWAARNNGYFITPAMLGSLPSETLLGGHHFAVLEDIETITHEEALFHLLRHVEMVQQALLLTSRKSARDLPFSRADIRSRLLSMPVAFLTQPDSDLLRAFYAKAFSDRQWRVGTDVVEYILLHSERSFAAAKQLLVNLEQLVASAKKEVTLRSVKSILDKIL